MYSSDGLNSVIQSRQDQVYAQIGIAVARKSLDAQQLQGEAAIQLLETAGEMAQQLGKGVQFDARA